MIISDDVHSGGGGGGGTVASLLKPLVLPMIEPLRLALPAGGGESRTAILPEFGLISVVVVVDAIRAICRGPKSNIPEVRTPDMTGSADGVAGGSDFGA